LVHRFFVEKPTTDQIFLLLALFFICGWKVGEECFDVSQDDTIPSYDKEVNPPPRFRFALTALFELAVRAPSRLLVPALVPLLTFFFFFRLPTTIFFVQDAKFFSSASMARKDSSFETVSRLRKNSGFFFNWPIKVRPRPTPADFFSFTPFTSFAQSEKLLSLFPWRDESNCCSSASFSPRLSAIFFWNLYRFFPPSLVK